MCLHPVIDRKLSSLYDKYQNDSLDEFDNCDYVYNVPDAKTTDLVVMQINIRGIGSKKSRLIDLIENSVHKKELDVVLISETWLTESSPEVNIPGYVMHRQDRSHKRGGGVAIVASSKLRCVLRPDLSSKMEESECVTLELLLRNGDKCLVSSMYRPPNTDSQTFLASYNSLVCAMKKEDPKGIIIGLDHNLDFLKSEKHQPTNDFIQSNLDFGLIPTVTRPTRITNTSATLIDNIMVSQNLCGSYTSNILINDTSDHLPVICVLNSLTSMKKESLVVKSRDTRLRNLVTLKKQVTNYDWTSLLTDKSPSKNMESVHDQLLSIIDHCTPYCEHKINHKQIRKEPWLTASIKISIDKNKKLYAKMLRGGIAKDKYTRYNNTLRKAIRYAKTHFYLNMCQEYKSQTRKLWKIINEIAGKHSNKSSLVEYLKVDNIKEYGAKKISNRFAKYFAEVGKTFAEKIPKSSMSITAYLKLLQSNKSSLFLNPTHEDEVKRLVDKLPMKNSSGHDNISNILLKEIVDPLAKVLVEIFNQSMTTGEFPNIMKLAEIVPLYKNKEHYLESNYRPISLLTTISKILEKIMYQRVYSFLQNTGQIYDNQFGFRANHSCEHAVGQAVSSIVKGIENKQHVACVLLDLSKAFDTIEHKILIQKLELYGIRGPALQWFKSYLTNRKLRVKCRTVSDPRGTISDDYDVHFGTPQGSCLGPLIFLIFVNDLNLNLVTGDCIQFADDTTLVFTHHNLKYLRYCVESELSVVQDWFNANKLTLNVGKSSYLLFQGHKQQLTKFQIVLNGVEIPRVNHAKLLGTWINDRLNWEIHANKVLTILKCGIGMLKRSQQLLSCKAKRLLYFGQIHSHLSYCLAIWGSMLSRHMMAKLAAAQRKAVSLIDPKVRTENLFCKYKILKLTELIEFELCKLGYKLCHGLLPNKLAKNMTTDHKRNCIEKVHKYPTRSKTVPNLPQALGTKYRSSFLYTCTKGLWRTR